MIDDVWSFQALKPFLSRRRVGVANLSTTRIFSVAVSAAGDERCRVNVGELTADEGLRMLSSGLSIPAASTARLALLAERLKRVPLLLELANRTLAQQVALGQSVDDALRLGTAEVPRPWRGRLR